MIWLVAAAMLVAPLTGNGYHKGWRNKKGPRPVSVVEQVQLPTTGYGSTASGADAEEGPQAHKYAE